MKNINDVIDHLRKKSLKDEAQIQASTIVEKFVEQALTSSCPYCAKHIMVWRDEIIGFPQWVHTLSVNGKDSNIVVCEAVALRDLLEEHH